MLFLMLPGLNQDLKHVLKRIDNMKKFSFIILTVVLMSCSLVFSSSALSVAGTYSDVSATSTQSNNLINYAMSYDSFIDSDFIVFCDQQNSYYIVWSDELTVDSSAVSGSDVEYIHYYRQGTTGSQYTYVYGIDSIFNLFAENLCTSNLAEFGFISPTFYQYRYQHNITMLFVLIASFGFVITVKMLRGSKS